jgi:hypothetical protein
MLDVSAKERMYKVSETRGSTKVVVKHFFRLPTVEDWERYFRGSSKLGTSRGRDTFELTAEIEERNTELWTALIMRVEGYVMGGTPLMDKEDWQDLIPVDHKNNAIAGFVTAWVPDEDVEEEVLDLGALTVDVILNVLHNEGDKVVPTELKFVFSTPDASDYKAHSRTQGRMRLTRTKERNVSSISVPTDIKPFVRLFDKLIQSVSGFVADGKPIMESDNWIALIDAFYKREAVNQLFGSESLDDEGKA